MSHDPQEATVLSPEEVDAYHQNGYLLPSFSLFSARDFERLKVVFEEDLALYGPDKLDTIHFRDSRLLEFLLADRVLNIIEQLIGPDIGLWSSHFICKMPHIGKATPWHEDSAYWNGRASTMEGICTIWLAMDESTPDNGCMRVIPGTHTNGFSDYERVDPEHNIFGTRIIPASIDESKAVYFALKPNKFSLHEARLIHGANANTSNTRRTGYTMRYFPTTTHIFPERNPGHKLWLARGADRAGNLYENS